jgi:phosphate-selective porin OprO and OprP
MRVWSLRSARLPARALGILLSILTGSIVAPGIALGDESPSSPAATSSASSESLQQLQQDLEQERQRLRALEQRLSADEAAKADAASTASARADNPNALYGSFNQNGFTLQNADGSDVIHFRGNASVDGRYFSDSYTPASDDTWLIRRLRPTLEGTLDNNFDFRFMPDFGQGKTIIQDAWADVRIEPWLVLQFGKFKAPVGLERLQLEQFARFIEVSLPSDLLPYRDLGAKVGGSIDQGVLTYDVGVFDGTLDGGSTDGNSVPDMDATGKFTWEGRIFSEPFLKSDLSWLQQFGLGIAETYVNDTGIATTTTTTSLLASYKTPGQQSMFSYRSDTATGYNNATIAQGIERRVVPQFYYYYRSWNLLGEYVGEDQQVRRNLSATSARTATLHNTGWEIQGAWFVTGENEGYASATPKRNFDFGHGGPGAWELVARIHEIHFDTQAFTDGTSSFASPTTSPTAAHAIGTGVNWYLNPNYKLQLDYEVTRYDGGAVVGNRPDERVLTLQTVLIF